MKKVIYFFISILLLVSLSLSNVNADYTQTSDPQNSEALAADDLLTSDEENKVVKDISNIIVDIGNLKNYVDASLGSIWEETSTEIAYNHKDVYLSQNLQVTDTVKVDGNVIIPEGSIKDNTITTNDVINGQIKKEDLDPAIFAQIEYLWKTNGDKGFYNDGNVGINDTNPAEKLTVDGNIKINNMWKGIIFPDGTIQDGGDFDDSNNMKIHSDQTASGVKSFLLPFQFKNGIAIEKFDGDVTLESIGQYGNYEGKSVVLKERARIKYGAEGKYIEKTFNPGKIKCDNNKFGGDPAPGVKKDCFVLPIGDKSVSNLASVKTYIDKKMEIDPSKITSDVRCHNNGTRIKQYVKAHIEYSKPSNTPIITYDYPIDISSITDFCENGDRIAGDFICEDINGNEYNCTGNEIFKQKIKKIKWECEDTNKTTVIKCGAIFDYECNLDMQDVEKKIKRRTVIINKGKILNDINITGSGNVSTNEYTIPNNVNKIGLSYGILVSNRNASDSYSEIYINNIKTWNSNDTNGYPDFINKNLNVKPGDKIKIKLIINGASSSTTSYLKDINLVEYTEKAETTLIKQDINYCEKFNKGIDIINPKSLIEDKDGNLLYANGTYERNCLEYKKNTVGETPSGYYNIKPQDKIFPVYCEMEMDGGGYMRYFYPKKDTYFSDDAVSCFKGGIINNDKLECFNPNKFDLLVSKLIIKKDGKLYSKTFTTDSTEVQSWSGRGYYCVGNPNYFSIMGAGQTPVDEGNYRNARYVRPGLDYCNYGRELGGKDLLDQDYMNYAEISAYGPTSGRKRMKTNRIMEFFVR